MRNRDLKQHLDTLKRHQKGLTASIRKLEEELNKDQSPPCSQDSHQGHLKENYHGIDD